MRYIEAINTFITKMIRRYIAHNIAATSAQIAYYWVLAFFPFLILVISLLSYTPIPTELLMSYISKIVPSTLNPFIEVTVNQFIAYRSTTLLSFSVLFTLWSGGTAINALTKGIHAAYNSKYIMPFFKARFLAIIYTLLFAILLIVMMVGLVFGNTVGDYIFGVLDMNKGIFMPIWHLFRLVMPFITLILIIYTVYKFIPRKYTKDENVWFGVIFTSVGWYVFSLIFGIYIDNYSKYNQLYGSIGSVFVLLIWLYGSCMLLLVGAELNALYRELRGKKIVRTISRHGDKGI